MIYIPTDELISLIEAKEAEGLRSALRENCISAEEDAKVLTLEEEYLMRMQGAAFIWECGRTGRLSPKIISEMLLNETVDDQESVYCIHDKINNKQTAKNLKKVEKEHLTNLVGPPLATVRKIEKSLGVTRTDFERKSNDDQEFFKKNLSHIKILHKYVSKSGSLIGDRAEVHATCQAIVLFHRFYIAKSFREFDRFLVAALCLYITFKGNDLLPISNSIPSLRIVCNLLHTMLPGNYGNSLDVVHLEEVLSKLEIIVMNILEFDLLPIIPQNFIIEIGRELNISPQTASLASSVLNDSFIGTDIGLRYPMPCIAATCILISLSMHQEDQLHPCATAVLNNPVEVLLKTILKVAELTAAEQIELKCHMSPTSKTINLIWMEILSVYDPSLLSSLQQRNPPSPVPLIADLSNNKVDSVLSRSRRWSSAIKLKIRQSIDVRMSESNNQSDSMPSLR